LEKILVTGATGFTGGEICKRLVNEGHKVTAFVRENSRTEKLKAMGVECRHVDLKDKKSIFDNFSEFSRIFHVAAAYRTEHADENEFWQVNVEATRHMLDAAKKFGVGRFVHTSTVGVQGDIKEPPADEDYRFEPGDHYQDSKLKGELLARDYFAQGLPGVVVRPVGIYGPGDTRFLKLFKAVNSNKFIMIGSGKTLYHMTYIDDLVQGFVLASQKEGVNGEVFTIAGEKYTTISELVNLVADVLGKAHPKLKIPFAPVYAASVICDKVCKTINVQPPIYPRRVEFFSKDRAFSIEKAKNLLDYKPAVSLEEGLKRTAQWYREQGLI
jgi:nucleoside-diphosphate-sugar epimerase